jgi:hypothetical protein
MKWMILTVLTAFMSQTAFGGEPEIYYRDHGWKVQNRYGSSFQKNGFTVAGKTRPALNEARYRSSQLDDDYNMAVGEIGAAGHGVAYPVYIPYAAFPPAPVMRYTETYYPPYPYAYPYRYYP